MSLETSFEEAQSNVKKLSSKPSNTVLLKLYALFKQGSAGDVSGKRPGMLDVKGRAKYDAWSKLKGTGQDDAKEKYVAFVNELVG
ncbi:acyl-CoA-binding protein [Myxococcota bacterium]|nr:acyl-CoA-binding protein [Myxococcota bacterium]